ncbi:uncharacterized protein LOC143560696 [Bidens hawaiensis]|uniref:uncharacterized protein LOC143560696 n=1 Tax=Bidens hawaiensis TaxID=980011 RepID=UPI00404991FA
MANHNVRRILVDGGSSVNIIQLETLMKLNILEDEILKKSSVLVEFSGEVKNTVGEIKLYVYIEGVNSIQSFCVMDSLSYYNAILGCPLIHSTKAVPSTYHQCIKMPTTWGVVKIASDKKEAKDCYTFSMKPFFQAYTTKKKKVCTREECDHTPEKNAIIQEEVERCNLSESRQYDV